MIRKNLGVKREFDEINKCYDHSDEFLGKDLLTIANKVNSSRSMMFHSHLEQAVVLNEPDYPRIFTNYEDSVGDESTSYWKAKDNFKVIKKISKFKDQPDLVYTLILQNLRTKEYHIVERQSGKRITEKYAFQINNTNIDNLSEDDVIEKNDVLFHSTSYDEDMNYRYGKNIKTCYLIDNRTTEDAVWVSESFVKSMKNSYIDEVEVTINTNDILCNIYCDKETLNEYGQPLYKSFPDIGCEVKDHILASRRRIKYESFLYEMQSSLLQKINYGSDSIFYAEGKVIDIDIYCNAKREDLEKKYYYEQILYYLYGQDDYYKELYDEMHELKRKKGAKYTSDFAFLYKKAKEFISPNVRFCSDNNTDFDNIIIKFKILHETDLHIGSKITGR